MSDVEPDRTRQGTLLGVGSDGWWTVTVRDNGTQNHGEYGDIQGVVLDVESSWGWSLRGFDLSASCAEAMRKALNDWRGGQTRHAFPTISNLNLPFLDGEPRYHITYNPVADHYRVRDRMTGNFLAQIDLREHATTIADALNLTQGYPPLYQTEEASRS